MNISPASVVYWGAFFVLFTLCALLHIHIMRTLITSGIGAGLFVLLTQSWWKRGLSSPKRPDSTYKDPALGTRAERRAQKKRRTLH